MTSQRPAPQDPRPHEQGFRRLARMAGWRYLLASAVARLPQSMLTLGALTYVAAGAADFTTPGAVAAIAGVGVGLGAPVMGAASDRWGQRPVLLVSTVAYVVALAALLLAGAPRPLSTGSGNATGAAGGVTGAVELDAPLAAAALFAGMVVPQISPMTRVRWIRRLTGPRDHSSVELALGYESTIDEMAYVVGPALVGIIAAAAGAPIPLVIAAVLVVFAVPAFAFDRSAAAAAPLGRTGPGPSIAADRIRWGFVAIGIAGMLAIGTVFGSLATTMTVFAEVTGNPGTGGLIYAAMGVTSGLGALSVSRWPSRWTAELRWLGCAVVAVPAAAVLLLFTEPWQMVLGMLLIGAPVGPVMVTVFAAAGRRTPPARLGFVMTLLSASVTLGTSVGNLLGGTASDAAGYQAALGVTVGASVALLLGGLGFLAYAHAERAGRGDRM